ncbi:MAG: hypothetical protein IID36_05575 [Planctomycetes bacterium]|nr:hypothetical protein [Planctomycetota bacterium]
MRGVCASLGLPVLLSIGFFATTTRAQCLLEEVSKVEASDEGSGDWFGVSVAINGTMVVVGSPRNTKVNQGAAYVYSIEGGVWIEEAVLTASDASTNDEFGWSVAISPDDAAGGRFVVVGAWDDDDACAGDPDCDSGAVYVFRSSQDGWLEEAKLVASDSASGDNFGVPVSISGDRILVGSMLDDDNGMNSGSVYIFQFDGKTWVEEAKLVAPDGEPLDWFGMSAAIAGDVAVVTALFDDDAATNAGAAYVFRRISGEWEFETKLTASDAAPLDYFGYSVALVREGAYLDTQVIVVGAPDADGGPSAAYVYRFNGDEWIEEQKLVGSGGTIGQEFGTSVAMTGDTIVVGAWLDDETGPNAGAGYWFLFDGSEWHTTAKLVSSDAASSDYLGWSVAFDGEYTVLGALGDDKPGINAGAAYLFVAEDCNENGQPDECDIFDGTSEDDNGNGVPDECESISILSSEPSDGVIDARQPSEPNGDDPTGWSEVVLTFDGDTGALTVEDFTVTLDPPGMPPMLAFVFPDGNDALLQFGDLVADPIPTGHWTIITHNASETSVRIGYLPADVNNDKLSNANDVLYLIDVLNGVIDPAPPAYQTDTDRSGATNASDVLRVIDLLNGAGVYDEYLGATLPD